jgi:catechol 2,3-dioxygenase-like lactoylglutathione lyase family enzyme
MRFHGVCLVTRDVPRLRRFYAEVLQVEAQGDDTFAWLEVPGAALSIFAEQGMERMAPGSMQTSGAGRYTLEFEVDDVVGAYDRVQALSVTVVKPLTTQAWGRRSIWFRDSDGNIINFFAPVVS